MHEMALTESIVELLEEEGRKQGFAPGAGRAARGRGAWRMSSRRRCVSASMRRAARSRGRDAGHRPLRGRRLVSRLRQDRCARRAFRSLSRLGGRHVQMTSGDELRVQELEVD